MSEDRDAYMRRQEMDHDLLRQRDNPAQRAGAVYLQFLGREARPSFAEVSGTVAARIEATGSFEWDLSEAPSPLEQIRKLLSNAGAAAKLVDNVTPALEQILKSVSARSYLQGERDGGSRARNPSEGG